MEKDDWKIARKRSEIINTADVNDESQWRESFSFLCYDCHCPALINLKDSFVWACPQCGKKTVSLDREFYSRIDEMKNGIKKRRRGK